jgi:hypothetical protein
MHTGLVLESVWFPDQDMSVFAYSSAAVPVKAGLSRGSNDEQVKDDHDDDCMQDMHKRVWACTPVHVCRIVQVQ